MNTARGFGLILAIALVALTGAVVWWVYAGEPGLATPLGPPQAPSPALRASPTAGVAPLSVTFLIHRDVGTVQTVDYGDGTAAGVADFICGLQYCTRIHIYASPGSYTARYEDASGQAVASFAITVSASP